MIPQVGARGADYVTRKDPKLLRSLGVTFVTRYICRGNSYKKLTATERDELLAGGFGIQLVWETSIDAPLKGAMQGTLDGREAAKEATLLGYPPSCDILAAVDTDAYAGNIQPIAAYLRAFHANCRPYGMGLYGDEDAHNAITDICGVWCLPNASGWSPQHRLYIQSKGLQGKPFSGHILQGREDKTVGMDVPNLVTKPFPVWSLLPDAPAPNPAPKPAPVLEDDIMNVLLRLSDDPAQFLAVVNKQGAALQVEWTGDGSDPRVQARIAAHRKAGLVDQGPASKADLRNCTLIGPVPPGWSPADFARVVS